MINARLPQHYLHCELESYHISPGHGERSQQEAKLCADKYCADFPSIREHAWLLFTGPLGVGKTHLAVGILKQVIRQWGVSGLFYEYDQLLKEIQGTYSSSIGTSELELLQHVFDADLLVLDDLGSTRPTAWVWDTASLILNTRYNQNRATIITTNFANLPAAYPGSGEMESEIGRAKQANRTQTLGDRITDRMHSRLQEMCRVIDVGGDDFRRTQKAFARSSNDSPLELERRQKERRQR